MNEYEKELKQFDDNLIKPTIVLPVIFITIVVLIVSFILGDTYTKRSIDIISTVIGLFLFTLTTFFPKLQFNRAHKTWLVLYHLALIGICATIMPVLSPFLAFWMVIAYVAQYYYKKVGLTLSLLALVATVIGGMWFQQIKFDTNNLFLAGFWISVIIGGSLVFSSIIKGTIQNRGLLANKMIRAEYEHERILSLVNGMSDAVIATDENGIINIYNSASMELLNTNTGLSNQQIDDVLKLNDINRQPIRLIDYAKALKNPVAKIDLYLDVDKNDRRILSINISRTTLFSTLGQQKGYTFVLRDTTEEKSLSEERDDFVSVVSHELRTPIAVAEANTALAQLQVKNPNAKQSDIDKSLNNAHRQILFLAEMVNDLATLSRAETSKNKIEIEKFSVSEILNEMDISFRPKADEKQLYFNIKIESDLPEMKTSKLYVKDILQNLISNAIKYTQKGGVEIVASKASEGMVMFAIKDTGMGITKAEQSKLFQKFWRSEDIHTRETEGTGLGLYISAKLANELGAKIKVDSVKGKGSTFSVVIPAAVNVGENNLEVIEKKVD